MKAVNLRVLTLLFSPCFLHKASTSNCNINKQIRSCVFSNSHLHHHHPAVVTLPEMTFPGWAGHFFSLVFRFLVLSLHISIQYPEWHLFLSVFDSIVVFLGPISGSVHMITGRTSMSVSLCDLLYAQGTDKILLLIPLSPGWCLVHGGCCITAWGIRCNEAEVGLLWRYMVLKAEVRGSPVRCSAALWAWGQVRQGSLNRR